MASKFYTPEYQALTDNNAPIPGAKLYFFTTGTLNPMNVYTDFARTTVLPNPVVVDSQGKFPPIYPGPDQLYRLRLTDAAGVLQWEEDGVPLQLNPRSKVESFPCNETVKPDGLDCKVLPEEFRCFGPTNFAYPLGNVLRYGADPTGVADSTAAIQRALNVAWASSLFGTPWFGSGGAMPVVEFPPGRYRITDTLTVANGVTVRGTAQPAHTISHTRIIMDSRDTPDIPANERTDNRNKPIFKFTRGTINNSMRVNIGVTSSIQHLEFWYVLPGGTIDLPHANGIAFGAYPDGGCIAFDVDAIDFRIVNCVFQHAPAAIRIKNVPITETEGCRADGWKGKVGVGIFIEDCEFDASCTHIYATASGLDIQFKNCHFYGGMHRYEGCTGRVVYQGGRWHGNAFVDAASVANTFEKFELKGADIEIGDQAAFLRLNKATAVDVSQNAFLAGASGKSCLEIENADAGRIGENAMDNSGYNASPASLEGSAAAIKLIGCRNVLVAANNITASGTATFNGVGILSIDGSRVAEKNYIAGNAVTAPYNVYGPIRVTGADILGTNADYHLNIFKQAAQYLGSLSSEFSAGPLRLGAYQLWVDTTGRLRMKNGAPTSQSDGVVIGTQT